MVLQDIPSNCTVVGVPGQIVRCQGKLIGFPDHQKLPDPQAEKICSLFDKVQILEKEIESLKILLLQNKDDSAKIELPKTTYIKA